jgi:hypothetical protein
LIEKQLLYPRRDAARALHLCESSFDLLVATRRVKVVRKGRRIFVTAQELERVAALDIGQVWPSKRNGHTTRHFAPPKPPTRAVAAPPVADQVLSA